MRLCGKLAVLGMTLLLGAQAVVAAEEKVDNPAYQYWVQYKKDTSVTYKAVASIEGDEVQTTGTITLEELTPDKVVVVTKYSDTVKGETHDYPAQKFTVPAKVSKELAVVPGVMSEAKVTKVKGIKEGKETIEVAGKKLETTTTEFTATLEGEEKEIWLKTWMTPEIPGGLAKMEMKTSGEEKVSKAVVTEYKVAK